jgi:hypothetical protein
MEVKTGPTPAQRAWIAQLGVRVGEPMGDTEEGVPASSGKQKPARTREAADLEDVVALADGERGSPKALGGTSAATEAFGPGDLVPSVIKAKITIKNKSDKVLALVPGSAKVERANPPVSKRLRQQRLRQMTMMNLLSATPCSVPSRPPWASAVR